LNLEENHTKFRTKLEYYQQIIKCWFDKKYVGEKGFQFGDLFSSGTSHTKIKENTQSFNNSGWVHFLSKKKIGLGKYRLHNLEWDTYLLPINGKILKHCIS